MATSSIRNYVESQGTPVEGQENIEQPPATSARPTLTVVRADDLPHLRTSRGKERRFYVTATDGTRTEKTLAIRSRGWSVQWDSALSSFTVTPSSPLIVSVFARRKWRRDIPLQGPVMIPLESLRPISIQPFYLGVHPTQRTSLTLSIDLPEAPNRRTEITTVTSPDVPVGPVQVVNASVDESRTYAASPDESVANQLQAAEKASRNAGEAMANLERPHSSLAQVMKTADSAPDHLQKVADLYDTWSPALSNVKQVVDIVDKIAEIHPWAKMAWSILSCIPKAFIAQVERDASFGALQIAIRDAFDLAKLGAGLEKLQPSSVQVKILQRMLHIVCECGDLIQNYAEKTDFWSRFMKNVGRNASEDVRKYVELLGKLQRGFLDHAIIATETVVLEIPARIDALSGQLEKVASGIEDIGVIMDIKEIQYPAGASFLLDKRCIQGTRLAFLNYITEWVNKPGPPQALVLFGQAGTGKSSIANEIAFQFHQTHRLASSFVFSRTARSNREDHLLLTGLVRDLADRYPTFRASLGKTIENNTSLRRARGYGTIFDSMLLKSLEDVPLIGPALIVIDALDESGDASGRTGLHTFLASRISDLPSNFRILITSRPEKDIVDAFSRASPLSVEVRHMDDQDLSTETITDIHTYVRHQLPSNLYELYGARLAEKAERSFQWAAVACDYIQYPPAGRTTSWIANQLLDLPSGGQAAANPLDTLYTAVLSEYFKGDSVLPLLGSIMGQLLAAFEPFSISSLAEMHQHDKSGDRLDEDSIRAVVGHLGSLLSNVTLPNPSLPILPLHTSFRDFLTDRQRAGKFWVDLGDAHHQLACCSFDLMHDELGFNMCNLHRSYDRNEDISDLPSLTNKRISPALSYACRFWDKHLKHAHPEELVNKLQFFFKTDFLHWLEAMSLVGAVSLASQAMSTVNVWRTKHSDKCTPAATEALMAWTNDALKFVQYFGMPIAASAPHIYLSALPFCPEGSIIFSHYAKLFPNTVSLQRGRLSSWSPQEMIIPVGGSCLSIAFSPDGAHIVSGSDDGTVRVWDAKTGQAVVEPFTGHTHGVNSVAFSTDGHHIASGSSDKTVHVWDAETGQVIAGPFTGHTDSVTSVAFSRDGHHIASGSHDGTVRVWDAKTGQAVVEPFTGHALGVNSIAFSPDGHRIASGSNDKTVRVWDSKTGKAIMQPFTQHEGRVKSVAFSPDGRHVASGSHDGTVRVWDAETGQAVAGPFTGRTRSVNSVAFSPDGHRIVSALSDHTVRVWDAKTGLDVAGPFKGHASWVSSVVFSPDGHHVASGSRDGTVCVWGANTNQAAAKTLPGDTSWASSRVRDTEIGTAMARPFTGHMRSVNSVAFSPDGRRIASSSFDETVRIWDAETGQVVAGPFTGHTSSVNSVAFSPDGDRIATGSHDGAVRVWDAKTGEAITQPSTRHKGRVKSVAFSPDGHSVASGSHDRTVCIWDAKTGQAIARPFMGHTDGVNSVAFSPDGHHIASGSHDKTVRVWDIKTGRVVARPFAGHTDLVTSVAFSPDGHQVASGSCDKTVRVWDTKTSQVVAGPFTGHTDLVASVTFSPDGHCIASGSCDKTVRFWDTKTGQIVAGPFAGHTHCVNSVAFSPDGRHIVSGSHDNSIRLWKVDIQSATETPLSSQAPSLNSMTHGTPRFTDRSAIDDDGWVRGPGGELFMWIPGSHRTGLYRPGNVWVASVENEVVLDLSRFVHGDDWARCMEKDTVAH